MNGNRRTAPAAKIKNGRALRKETEEALDQRFINPRGGTAVGVP
jgi:hypothetical protein